jgi:molybdopterin-guanine dinucleotide biosynthesis protein MobB
MNTRPHERPSRLMAGLDFFLEGNEGGSNRGAAAAPHALEEISLLRSKRIGLLCNPASVTLDFVPAPQALLAAGLDVRVLFGPEHGLTGAAQDMEAVGAGEPSRLPVISLYGETFADLAPKPEHLEGLDAVVCDLPDVGSRYYTFVWSIALVMRECAKRSIPVVVLDRPNPLGGEVVEGNLPEEKLLSFVGLYPVPVRHGMTAGEIARWTNATQGFGCDLTVVPLRKAGRAPVRCELAETPAWVLPSPNMPTPGTALVYPGACLVEGTNLSEGRGTTRPFELVGAPWLDADDASERANALAMPGVVFRPHVFIPTFQKQAGRTCGGVQAHVTDSAAFRPYETYLRLLKELRDMDPGHFEWRTETYEYRDDVPAIDLLTGTATYRRLVDGGESLDPWIATFDADIARFAPSRASGLLYPSKKSPSPVVLLVTGAHESGKTTVAVQLIEALVKEGLKVGSLKHTDHEYETDVEGKDSQRHKAAGAEPAVLVAGRRSAVHRRGEHFASNPSTGAVGARTAPPLSVFLEGEYGLGSCDVVVVEGYRSEAYPKIEVCRAATGRAPLCEADSSVIAVVTDRPTGHATGIPRFTFEEIPGSFLLFLRESPVFSSMFSISSGGAP